METEKKEKRGLWGWFIAGGLGTALFFAFKSKNKNNNDPNNETNIFDAEDEINQNELSHSEAWYNNAATLLREAMDRVGTDEDTIYDVLNQLNNSSDWYKLYATFGNYTPSFWSWNYKQLTKGDLTEWLIEELDGSEIATVRNILSQIGVLL